MYKKAYERERNSMKKHMLKRPGHIWIFITCFAVAFVTVLLVAVFGKLNLADENSNEISKNESLSLSEEVNEADSEADSESDSEAMEIHMNASLPEMTVEEIAEESNLVAIGTLKEISPGFCIQSVEGGTMNYTEYYFQISDTCRGVAPDNADQIAAVRIPGGEANGVNMIWEDAPTLEVDETYLLFLYKPQMGGSFNTEGDYYYLSGDTRGIYQVDSATAFSKTTDDVYTSSDGTKRISHNELIQLIDQVNEEIPADIDMRYQEFLENQQYNLETGFISQEEYDRFLSEAQRYATYYGEPPAGYSGE